MVLPCQCSTGFTDNWKPFALFGAPLLFALVPLLWHTEPPAMARCAFVALVMMVYWITEVIPIAVTAFIPLVAYPFLGIMDAEAIAVKYFPDTNVLFLGGLIIAIAVEESNFHRRLSLIILSRVGSNVRSLLAGVMISTAFFSLFIANTATTAMMCPIVLSLCREVIAAKRNFESSQLPAISECDTDSTGGPSDGESGTSVSQIPMRTQMKRISVQSEEITADSVNLADISAIEQTEVKALMLSICYSASIGGTGSLTGTGPNVIMLQALEHAYPGQPLNFGTWLAFNILGTCINLILGWFVIQAVIIGPKSLCVFKKSETHIVASKAIDGTIKRELHLLGPITWAEGSVIGHFVTVFMLWLLRQPVYGQWFAYPNEGYPDGDPKFVDDGTPAMLVALCLFVWPKNKPKIFSRVHSSTISWLNRRNTIRQSGVAPQQRPTVAFAGENTLPTTSTDVPSTRDCNAAILTWRLAEKTIPWGMIFLVGGGYALGSGIKATGLSSLIGETIKQIDMSATGTLCLCVLLVAILTEVTSNSATTSLLTPIVLAVADARCINPLYLGLPVAVAASYAFMLPVATPPNSIVFQNGLLRIWDMAKTGFFVKVVCVLQILVAINVWGSAMFHLNEWPEWGGNCTMSALNNSSTGGMNITEI